MKITIELTEWEVKGIRAYLSNREGEKAGRKDIQEYISNVVAGVLQNPKEAVCHYIDHAEFRG